MTALYNKYKKEALNKDFLIKDEDFVDRKRVVKGKSVEIGGRSNKTKKTTKKQMRHSNYTNGDNLLNDKPVD